MNDLDKAGFSAEVRAALGDVNQHAALTTGRALQPHELLQLGNRLSRWETEAKITAQANHAQLRSKSGHPALRDRGR